jgi:outer membrane receptor protein involved in Fe transport
MRIHTSAPRLSAVSAAVSLSLLPWAAFAQLEEIVVTAQRRETNLQSTPISIQAFTAEDLDLGGLQTGADLGIMVPNLVANPSGAGGGGLFYVRGLPGVGIYIDGIWQSTYGFLESNFAEVERVEVLRGPQGTLFGRNTNGGAISITTRAPGDEFSMRMNFEIGEYNRRNATIAADLPLSPTLKSKWMVSSRTNDGWLESVTLRQGLAGQDDQLFRGDILWEPTDRFSLRLTANDEDKRGTDARIVRFTNLDHPQITRYNVLAGNPDYLAMARAVDPNFPVSPFTSFFPSSTFGPETHEPGYPGGELGDWETKSDNAPEGLKRDLKYYTVTMNWDIGENLQFESITSAWEMDRRVTVDYDGSEFTFTVDENRSIDTNFTQEFHLTGSNLDGRVTWLAGLFTLNEKTKSRADRWAVWDLPRQPGDINIAPTPRDRMSVQACQYIYNWATTVYNTAPLPIFPAGGPCATTGATTNVIGALNPSLWTMTLPGSTRSVTNSESEQNAFFGEVTLGLTEKLDMTLGVRITEDSASRLSDSSPPLIRNEVSDIPRGDIFAVDNATFSVDPDFGRNTTNKLALQYELNDDVMLYTSWGEGFTEAAEVISTLPVIAPGGCPSTVNQPVAFPQSREVVTSRELGLRSDWLDNTLRFNASYFDASWDGMRVATLATNPCSGDRLPQTIIKSDGKGEASGFEFEVVFVPTDRLSLNLNIGILDTQYLATGAFTDTGNDLSGTIVVPLTGVNGTGIASLDSAFAYAPDQSFSLGIQYEQPLSSGAGLTYVANYGYMSKYVRDTANHRIPRDANGNPEFEPGYGLLNGRVVYTPSEGDWTAELWATNITDKQYVNGGFDTHTVWGFNFSVIGPPREVGASLNIRF